MDRSSSRIDPLTRRRRALAGALGVLLVGMGVLRALALHRRWIGGALVVFGCALWITRSRKLTLSVIAPIDRALGVLGEVMGTVLLTIVYVVLVLPYSVALRALGKLPPREETWPDTTSGWRPIEDARIDPDRRSRRGLLGSMVSTLQSAASLVGFLWRRPSAVLVPIVLVILVFAAGLLIGEVTGLGPLIYSIF